jgi:hypothetical protein
MVKFVASVVAGIIATVLGGLILNYVNNSQQVAPPATAPSSAPAVDFSDLIPKQPHSARPGVVLDAPGSSAPPIRVQTPRQQKGFLTYSEAEQACNKGDRIWKFEHGPDAGRYFCFP